MSCSPFIFYLVCLAYLSALITAQSCNTTGTYASCCDTPSSDNKIIEFQGKEFRVHCNSVIGLDFDASASPADCAQKCTNKGNCVSAYWNPQGTCETRAVVAETGSLSLVLVDSVECKNKLKTCQDALDNCTPGDPNCAGDLTTCLGDKRNCLRDKKKCDRDLAKCKKKPPPKKKNNPGPFSCVDGMIENIGGTNYRHHCSQVQVRARSHQPMVSAADPRECAKQCTQRGCAFIIFVNANACYLHEFGWNSGATKASSSGYTVLERV